MAWAKLDDRMPDNQKVAVLSDAAFRAYVTSICYCARELTDGFLPLKKAREFAGRARVIQELVPGFWAPQGQGFNVHDYLQYNPSREEVLATKAERSKAGSKGAASRWQSDSKTHGKSYGKEDGKTDAPLPVNPPPIPDPKNPEPDGPVPGSAGLSNQPTELRREIKTAFENRVGFVPPSKVEEFYRYVEWVPKDWFIEAIEVTRTKAQTPCWAFCKAVLDTALERNQPPGNQDEDAPPMSLNEVLDRRRKRAGVRR